MAWLTRNGYRVAPFKVGPDFIDPGHHNRITGAVSRNLDGWLLSRRENIRIFEQASRHAHVSVVEGVMGLFDGYDGRSEAGSTAQMAKWLGLPVILVVDAKNMARSAAALIKGFMEFDPELSFMGVIFNNLGSPHHYTYLTEAVSSGLSIPVIGGILQDDRIAIPERHLGLVTDDEHSLTRNEIDNLYDLADKGLDMTKLVPKLSAEPVQPVENLRDKRPLDLKIAVARDQAFCFYYPDNLERLREQGAELIFFSPLSDTALPQGISGIYLGGGYPEMFARQLSENCAMRVAVKQASDSGMPVYGECGGFMYLCRSLKGRDNTLFPMTDCFPFTTSLRERLASLGYREVTLKADTILGPAGSTARGHEFHYSEIVDPDQAIATVYRVSGHGRTLRGDEGFRVKDTIGSWVHLHFGSAPGAAKHFVAACRAFNAGI